MKVAVTFGLTLFVLFLAKSRAQQCPPGDSFCTGINQCYSPNNYGCIPQPGGNSNFLCPYQNCLCGQIACYLPSQYGCDKGSLTQDTTKTGGTCPGGTGGDPLVRGFDSCRWYLQGVAGKIYNLVSGPDDTVNTELVPANLTDATHSGNGTYHGRLAFRHKDHTIEAEVSAAGNLTVTVDGQLQPFDSRFEVGEIKGKVVRHFPFFGQFVSVTTPSFTYSVQAVQPFTTETGEQRGHADLDITLRKPVAGLHGLLGQSAANIKAPNCRDDFDFPGVGSEADYEVASISTIPQEWASAARVSRRLIEDDVASFLPVTATTAA